MYKIAICDDDDDTCQLLSKMIGQKFNGIHKLHLYTNPVSLELFIDEDIRGNLDILILDINLGDENGIEVAKRITAKYPHIKTIFFSAYSSYAGDIFDVNPVYFLIKPIEPSKLVCAIEAAKKKIEIDRKDYLSISCKGIICNLDLRKIMYIESINRTVQIYDINQSRQFYLKLADLEKMLTSRFCRCHQSYIVNMDYVNSVSTYSLELNNGKNIPISQSRYKSVKKRFLNYLGTLI